MCHIIINQSKLQHIIIDHRQIVIHVSQSRLLHGKSAHCAPVILVYIRSSVSGCNYIVV